jgi:hypothetical protein
MVPSLPFIRAQVGRKLLPGEAIETYTDDIRRRLRELNMPEHVGLSIFLDGLPIEIRKIVCAAMPNTFNDADKLARNAVKVLKIEEHSLATMKTDTNIDRLTATVSDLAVQVRQTIETIDRPPQRRTTPDYVRRGAPGRNQRNTDGVQRCYECGQPGHYARYCERNHQINSDQPINRTTAGRQNGNLQFQSQMISPCVRQTAAVTLI